MTTSQLQAYANFMAGLRHHGLDKYVLSVPRSVEQDRLRAACFGAALTTALNAHPAFSPWDKNLEIHGPDVIASWRENEGLCSLQVTLHCNTQGYEIELDYDYGNPAWGLAPLLVHGWEFLKNMVLRIDRTDPFVIRKYLNKRGYNIPLAT